MYIGETSCHLSTRIEEHKGIPIRQVKLYKIHPIAVYCNRDDIDSSCLPIIYKSELRTIKFSERIIINELNYKLNNQDASTKLNICKTKRIK